MMVSSIKMVLRVEWKLFVIEQLIFLVSPIDSEYLRSGMRMRENQLAHMSLDEELCGTGNVLDYSCSHRALVLV
ncbi:hypothetical protein Tco_0789402 [Tanacetum coccineum]